MFFWRWYESGLIICKGMSKSWDSLKVFCPWSNITLLSGLRFSWNWNVYSLVSVWYQWIIFKVVYQLYMRILEVMSHNNSQTNIRYVVFLFSPWSLKDEIYPKVEDELFIFESKTFPLYDISSCEHRQSGNLWPHS